MNNDNRIVNNQRRQRHGSTTTRRAIGISVKYYSSFRGGGGGGDLGQPSEIHNHNQLYHGNDNHNVVGSSENVGIGHHAVATIPTLQSSHPNHMLNAVPWVAMANFLIYTFRPEKSTIWQVCMSWIYSVSFFVGFQCLTYYHLDVFISPWQ